MPSTSLLRLSRAALGSWPREAFSGCLAALVTVALVISLGSLAWSPLGLDAARLGATAAFMTAGVSALVYALCARSRLPAGGPTSPSSLMVMALLAGLLADPALPAVGGAGLGWLAMAVAAAVVVQGLLQLLLAALGWVDLVRRVPQPVLSGFMNAIAALVLLGQAKLVLGVPWADLKLQGLSALAGVRPGSLLLAAGTAAVVWWLLARRPRWPAVLLGMLVGTLVFHGLQQAAAVVPALPALDMGPTAGRMALDLPILAGWRAVQLADCQAFLMRHAWAILSTGAALALVCTLETLLAMMAVDQQLGTRSSTRRELAGAGLANVLGGLCGALPMGLVRSRAVAMMTAGGRSRRAAAISAIGSLVLFSLGSPLLDLLPLAVLGGIMVTVAWALVDPWSRSLLRQWRAGERSRELLHSLAVVGLVLSLTVWYGPIFGVGLGLTLAVLLFVRQISTDPVRAVYSAAQRPSRRVYPAAVEARLAGLRGRVQVLELQGALFFGNVEPLRHAVATLPAGLRVLVLDLRRVSTVDATGAHALAQLAAQLRRNGQRLLLAQVQAATPLGRQLQIFGAPGAEGVDWFVDADHAVEAAEQSLLADAAAPAEAAAADFALFDGLDAGELAILRAHLQPVQVRAGQAVFRQGDAADALYLLASGSIRIVSAGQGAGGGTRYVSLSPGTWFGEAAVLDGGGRSADAVADADSALLRLDQAALAALAQAHPALGARLYRNLARYLAQRLRVASAAWTAAAG